MGRTDGNDHLHVIDQGDERFRNHRAWHLHYNSLDFFSLVNFLVFVCEKCTRREIKLDRTDFNKTFLFLFPSFSTNEA